MKKTKKIISLIFCVLFVLSCFNALVYAENSNEKPVTRISCTVNGNTSTQRGFCWYTKEKCDSQIIIAKNGIDVTDSLSVKKDKVKKWNKNYVHKLTVEGLEPDTVYTYKVGSDKGFSDEGTFKTDDLDNSLDFIVFADVQASNYESFKLSANALKKGFEIMPDPDFICSLGDFTNDSTNEEWDYYFENFEQINICNTLVPIAGNHDGLLKWGWFDNMFSLDTSKSVQNLNGVNYSFDYANAHFAVLNTNDELCVSTTQLNWLESDLKLSNKDWKIVLMHKSPYTLGKDGRVPDAQYLQVALPPVLDRCGVDIVFSGHDHMYLRTKKLKGGQIDESGTTYVLSGTLGTKRYAIRTYLAGTYLNTDHIATLRIQHPEANYWNGSDWNSYDLNNIGCCFNCISIRDDQLTLNSYIYRDELSADNEDVVTCVDTLTLSKRASTYDENSREYDPNIVNYIINFIPSLAKLAKFTFMTWIPNFIASLLKGQKYY